MPLNVGGLTINPSTNIVSGSGLSKELYDALAALTGVTAASGLGAQQQITGLAAAIASTVIAHIKANAQVNVASGIPVTTNGSATTQTGFTTAIGSGNIE